MGLYRRLKAAITVPSPDPIDHPAIRRMSLRELADLPFPRADSPFGTRADEGSRPGKPPITDQPAEPRDPGPACRLPGQKLRTSSQIS